MTNSKPRTLTATTVDRFLNKLATDSAPVRRPFAPPLLPPGVVPSGAKAAIAQDSSGGGTYGYLNGSAEWCGLGFPGYPYLSNLTQRSEYRAPTETIASELTRQWIKFTGTDEAKLKELEEAFTEFAVRDCFRQVAVLDGFFGRGQLSINIKGQETDARRQQPLVVDDEGATIAKGMLLGFKPIDPLWTTPYAYNSLEPTKPDFYKPESWYVLGKRFHASRLLTFVGRPVPDILKPSYNFGGMSLSQLIEPYVTRWLKTVDSVNRLVSNFSTSGLATNMQATLEGGDGDGGAGVPDLFKRAQLFNALRDNRGLMLLDKDTEEFFQVDTSLAGLAELQAQAQEHMAAPTHIPLVKLTGITPDGLNASSEGEIKVFYDFIASEQENLFTAHLTTVLRIVQLHLWGKVDPDIGFEWVPLDSPSDKEESEMRKADGDRDTSYVGAGIVSPEEVRERLRTDPNSGYTFIEGDAPVPPLEAEHELGLEGAEHASELGEKNADAQAQRDADAREHEAKLAPKPKPAAK